MTEEPNVFFRLIRDGTVLIRVSRASDEEDSGDGVEFFDVRTGVQLREIHPGLQEGEVDRGYTVSAIHAEAFIRSGTPSRFDPSVEMSKIVSLQDVRQRRLDSVVADSILDQLGLVRDVLDGFLTVADNATEEERFWLSQQVLTILRKFSGRELEELEEVVRWFRTGKR